MRRNDPAQSHERVPVRRLILEALAEKPALPSALAARVGAHVSTVSRYLAPMRDQHGLVDYVMVDGDQRLRRYSLTREGMMELSRLRSADPRPPAPPPADTGERVAALRAALRTAVALRRQTNKLDVAAERLAIVLERAEALPDHGLIVDTLSELATTLRQQGRTEEVDAIVDRLRRISLGDDEASRPSVVLSAFAHRKYALGRAAGGDSVIRAEHLHSAADTYRELAVEPTYGLADDWNLRVAWSTAGLAANLREQSDFEAAFIKSLAALRTFTELEDTYGQTRCYFLLGFCLRLLGNFDNACTCLSLALSLAQKHGYERYQADVMLQLGEVQRTRGDLEEAHATLREAVDRANRLDLKTTRAFAYSALGAVSYQQDHLGRASQALAKASTAFRQIVHPEGLALNERRRAVVLRHRMGPSGRQGDPDAVRAAIAAAREGYRALQSPAGLAACDIETGQLARLTPARRSSRSSNPVSELHERLLDPDQRVFLEEDPWVPPVLMAFARVSGDPEFVARAERLTVAAARRRTTSEEKAVAESSNVVDLRVHRDQISTADDKANEMGGETRRVLRPLALVAA